MAPHASSSTAPVLPGRPHLALAIAILRLKPESISVREYLSNMRQHIKSGYPAHTEEDQAHYLDLVGYWREQCQQVQEECESLRVINVKLERSNQRLANSSGTLAANHPATATVKSKRKAPASPTKSNKRRKDVNANSSSAPTVQTPNVIESDYDFFEGLGPDGASLLQKLYTTHQLCRASDAEATALCKTLVQTTSALAKIIGQISLDHEKFCPNRRRTSNTASLEDDKSDFAFALTASARAFMSVLVGTAKMTELDDDQRYSSLITCELTELFRVALLAIGHCARRTAENASTAPTVVSKGRSKTDTNATIPKESVAARSLAHFLVGLLGLLDEDNLLHHKIFDGFVFILLEHVGKRLYFCTFGRHRGNSMESSLGSSSTTSSIMDTEKDDIEALGIRLEVKALILILHRAMGLAPHHMRQTGNKPTEHTNSIQRTLSMKTLPSAPKSRLSAIAKDRLQRTLVSCMYGTKGDDEFLDVLTKPLPGIKISSLPSVVKVLDEDVEQWYKEQVWRLVGWDVLAKDMRR